MTFAYRKGMSTIGTRFSKVTDLLPHAAPGKRVKSTGRHNRKNHKTAATKRRAVERQTEYVLTEFGRRPARTWKRKLVIGGSIAAAAAAGLLWMIL
jgi:hypothetical protein